MICNDMRLYNYYTYSGKDAYAQPKLSAEPVGQARIAIYLSTQSVQDNINYSSATYVGLTNALLDDSCVIDYEGKKLKVLYIDTRSRFKQLYMSEI